MRCSLKQTGFVAFHARRGQKADAGERHIDARQRLLDGVNNPIACNAAAASKANDQLLHRLGGRSNDRFGIEQIGNAQGQVVGAAFMAAE